MSMLLILGLRFPNLMDVQLAKFLLSNGASSPGYVCTLSIGTITTEFLHLDLGCLMRVGLQICHIHCYVHVP